MPQETFQEKLARAQAEPQHRKIDVPKISVDLTLPVMIQQMKEVFDAAHAEGEMSSPDHQEISAASEQLLKVLARIDHKKIREGLLVKRPDMFRRLRTPR